MNAHINGNFIFERNQPKTTYKYHILIWIYYYISLCYSQKWKIMGGKCLFQEFWVKKSSVFAALHSLKKVTNIVVRPQALKTTLV